MWFTWIGNGTRVGLDDPHPAPDGCLCDAARPDGAYYKQGDGIVAEHDWALEESLGAVITQAEQLLVDRDAAVIAAFLPLFNRTLALIESRRDAASNLFYSGVSCNLMAPSFGGFLAPNGSRLPAFLAGMSVSYIAALDRVIELEELAGGAAWAATAAAHRAARALTLAGLPALLAPGGRDYFVKWLDPDGTPHGVLGAARHGYIEAVVNHDAVALGVAARLSPALPEAIMSRLLGGSVPPNPATGGAGLRPHSFVITNAGGLDDMEEPDTSWLWQFGTWVNGGAWPSCEARMMLAYWRTGRYALAAASMRAMLAFADVWRMDAPLVAWGSAVYEPSAPINTVYDDWAVPGALLRGLFDPAYTADALTLTPHVPHNLTALNQTFPLRWGPHRIFLATRGDPAQPITAVDAGGAPWANFTASTVTLPWAALPAAPTNLSIVIRFGGAARAEEPASRAADGRRRDARRAGAARVLRTLIPQDALLWLDASTLALADGAAVARWPDASGRGYDATQAAAGAQPRFAAHGAAAGRPAVVFDGMATFLANAALPLPAASTIFAVFRDGGTSNVCCTGVFFSAGGCNGLGTRTAAVGANPNASVLMIDWSGSPDSGVDDIAGRQVVASVVYNASGAFSAADACPQSAEPPVGAAGLAYMVG